MRPEVANLIYFINKFLEQKYNRWDFNYVRTMDFVTFEMVDSKYLSDAEKAFDEELHSSLQFLHHYLNKLKNSLESSSYDNYRGDLAATFTSFQQVLNEWLNSVFADDEYTNTRFIPHSSPNGDFIFELSFQDLLSFRILIDGFLNVLSNKTLPDNTDILKFRILSDPETIQAIKTQLHDLGVELCSISLDITLHYRNRLAQQSDSNEARRWNTMEKTFQTLMDKCLQLQSDCQLHSSLLTRMSIPVIYQEALTSAVNDYTTLTQQIGDLIHRCDKLKQNFNADARFSFQNFPLAWSFHQTEKDLDTSIKLYSKQLSSAIIALCFFNLMFFVFLPLRFEVIANNLLLRILPALGISLPLIWMAWHATKHINIETRLKHDNAYRATLAATYSTYTAASSTIDPEVSKDALKEIFAPTTHLLNNKEPSSPYEALLNFFKGRTVRKVLLALVKDGGSSLKELIVALTGLINSAQDKDEQTIKAHSSPTTLTTPQSQQMQTFTQKTALCESSPYNITTMQAVPTDCSSVRHGEHGEKNSQTVLNPKETDIASPAQPADSPASSPNKSA